jgi:hypothetical protein
MEWIKISKKGFGFFVNMQVVLGQRVLMKVFEGCGFD